MRIVDTSQVAKQDRLEYWRQEIGRLWVNFDFRHHTNEIVGRVDVWHLEHVRLARVEGSAQCAAREGSHRSDGSFDGYCLVAQAAGTSAVAQGDVAVQLAPNELTLVDASLPFQLDSRDHFIQYSLDLPRETVNGLFPSPPTVRRLPADSGVNRVLFAAIRVLTDHSLPPEHEETGTLEDHLLALLRSSLRGRQSSEAAATASEKRVLRVVSRYLTSPSLNLDLVAAESRLSRRYIQGVFHRRGTTFSQFVRTSRIERCVEMMRSPGYADMSITELAAASGFRELSTFCRAFAAVMKRSAREYRASLQG